VTEGSTAIRPATLADAAELARLISPLGYPINAADVVAAWTAWTDEGGTALVVQGERSLLGVVTLHSMRVLHRPRPVGRITSLAVDPSVRGQGFGRALVAAAEQALAEGGCGMVEITSHARRSDAHAFYRHLGYEQTSFRFAKPLP
jgi:GNAT superfamily N-acetyltransferase